MRTIIVFFLFSVMCYAQESDALFHIIKVDGSIENIDQSKIISTGDKILPTDKLLFETINASALAINKKSEKYSLKKPSSSDILSENERYITAMLSASPVISRNQLSTRGLQENDQPIVDLKTYFGKETFTVIGDSMSVKLDENIYPLNNDKFIVFYYKINDMQISKKVGFNKQNLVLEKDKLFEGLGEKQGGNILNKVEVYQYQKSKDISDKITEINLQFINKEELDKEFSAILPVLNGLNMGEGEKQAYLLDYFGDVYGLTDQNSILKYIEEFLAKTN